MKNNSKDFQEIEILKERQKLRILQQEMKIKSGFRELTDKLTGAALLNRVRENLFSGSGLAFKLGFMAVSMITDRISKHKRKK
jgi:hypothetical protein